MWYLNMLDTAFFFTLLCGRERLLVVGGWWYCLIDYKPFSIFLYKLLE